MHKIIILILILILLLQGVSASSLHRQSSYYQKIDYVVETVKIFKNATYVTFESTILLNENVWHELDFITFEFRPLSDDRLETLHNYSAIIIENANNGNLSDDKVLYITPIWNETTQTFYYNISLNLLNKESEYFVFKADYIIQGNIIPLGDARYITTYRSSTISDTENKEVTILIPHNFDIIYATTGERQDTSKYKILELDNIHSTIQLTLLDKKEQKMHELLIAMLGIIVGAVIGALTQLIIDCLRKKYKITGIKIKQYKKGKGYAATIKIDKK
jgi:hypothetical protein